MMVLIPVNDLSCLANNIKAKPEHFDVFTTS